MITSRNWIAFWDTATTRWGKVSRQIRPLEDLRLPGNMYRKVICLLSKQLWLNYLEIQTKLQKRNVVLVVLRKAVIWSLFSLVQK